MNIIVGHVLVLKLPFANGAPCFSKRPFLVIDKKDQTLDLLNISSTKGKERKLLFPSNLRIKKFYPPLDNPSFIKMDELYTIDNFDELHKSLYKNRPPIITEEVNRIISEYSKYRFENEVTSVKYLELQVKNENAL